MVVRELLTMFGVKPDAASFRKAEAQVGGLTKMAKNLIMTFGGLFAGYKVAGWFRDVIGSASDANETLNVLDASFKDQQERVMTWAKNLSDAAGRSEYAMREMAGTLGAVLNPMLEYNSEAVAGLSMDLAHLTVDLGSFYNAAEPDVLIALRAGITGEAEPLKRFGIVMNQAALEAFRLREGIKGNIKTMSVAEKTMLRYQFIMDATQAAQGDAIKTSKGWANATKMLSARLRDFSTRIGLMLMPSLEKTLQGLIGATDALEPFGNMIGRALKSVMEFVGWIVDLVKNMDPATRKLALVGLAILSLGKIIRIALSPFGKWLILITAIILLLEDFQVWLEGGNSALGKLLNKIKEWTGLDFDKPLREFIQSLKLFAEDTEPFDWGLFWNDMVDVATDYIDAAMQEWSNLFNELGNTISGYWDGITSSISGYFRDLINDLSTVLGGWWDSAKQVGSDFLGFFISIWGSISESASQTWNGLIESLTSTMSNWLDSVKQTGSNFLAFFSSIWDSVATAASGMGDSIWNAITETFDNLWTYISKWADDVIGDIVKPFKTAIEWAEKLGDFFGFGGGEEAPQGSGETQQTSPISEPQIAGLQSIMPTSPSVYTPTASVGSTTNNQSVSFESNPNIKVDVHPAAGMDEASIGRSVEKHVSAAIQKENRKAAQAFRQKALPGAF